MQMVIHKCTGLARLNLSHCSVFSNLTLVLQFIQKVTGQTVVRIGKYLPEILRLDLSWIGETGFVSLIEMLLKK